MYYKHGGYFFVEGKGNKWIPLGRHKTIALYSYAEIVGKPYKEIVGNIKVAPIDHDNNWDGVLYSRAKTTSIKRGIGFTLTRKEFDDLVAEADGRCMLTGIKFQWEFAEDQRKRPYIPSLDRIDSALGYHYDNCRIVCACVNYALHEWGVGVLINIAKHLRRKRLA